MIARGQLFAALAIGLAPVAIWPTASQAQISIGVSVRIGPPPLPVYVQPPIPGPDYIWAPGYWSWDDWWGDYYWVPGTWVLAPRPGLLWTPGWWGWSGGSYAWHGGYWGPHVGWYGGISYGFGYTGSGYYGGEWRGSHFYYNRSVNNVNNSVSTVYNRTIVNNTTIINNNTRNVSYSGGPGGIAAQPTAEQRMAMAEPHIAATPEQVAHVRAAQSNRAAFASVNQGRPAVLARARPLPAPAGPIHPPGMGRPAPGGGLPGAGVREFGRRAPDTATAEGTPANRRSEMAGRPDQPGQGGGAPLERAEAAGKTDATDAGNPAVPSRPIGNPSDARALERADRVPPVEHPYPAAYRPPNRPAPAYRQPPPPEHRAPPREGGGGQHGGHPAEKKEHHPD